MKSGLPENSSSSAATANWCHLAVGRLTTRSDADLTWETELLQYLSREGLNVPLPIPTIDGRLFADGLVVWARLAGRQTCVVHGNPNNPENVPINADRVALLDWDESQVDVPDLDLVLPHYAAGLDLVAHDIAAQASAAWEAAVCWDHEYSLKRLAQIRAV